MHGIELSGETMHVFTATPTHVAFEEYDVATQIGADEHPPRLPSAQGGGARTFTAWSQPNTDSPPASPDPP